MMNRNIIVIGGSAGSFKALRELLSLLPQDLDATIFAAIHRARLPGMDHLPSFLSRHGQLRAATAVDRGRFECGCVYLAPPGVDLIVGPGVLRLESPAKPRPPRSVDVLFQSAAKTYRERVVGVLLSGMMHDGTAGSWEIRRLGGVTIAQDPNEAAYASMPQKAMQGVPIDYCLPIAEIAVKLEELVAGVATPPASQTARVMIVEDEWLLASELERQFTELGYTVVGTVASGEQALSIALSAAPDIVLMDVGLAGKMKGTEAAVRFWEEFQVPIIFLTARADQETLAAAQASMPYAFLAKPHTVGQLHSAVQLALGRRQREMQRMPSAKTGS
jgi:chemotaxis response regulator CheB